MSSEAETGVRKMSNVYNVANFFIDAANRSEDDVMTNLKLNKLMYFAQGCFLARTGRRLFDADIEAWTYGPAIPQIYHKYKVCGRDPIHSIDEDYDISSFSEEEVEVLIDVMRELGCYTGSALVSITHKANTPWRQTRESAVIEDELLTIYFLKPENEIKRFHTSNEDAVDALPEDWYDPAEDQEWETYVC